MTPQLSHSSRMMDNEGEGGAGEAEVSMQVQNKDDY